MVCKIIFCSEFPDTPAKTEKKGAEGEEEEHRQLQSVMRFTQMLKTNVLATYI